MGARSIDASMPGSLVDGRFLLLETIGRGGMGTVYRAFDRGEDRVVALKVLEESDGDCGPGSAVAREFTAWSSVRHPNVVRAYELGIARRGPVPSGTPYLVLELVHGGPLHRVLVPGRVPADTLHAVATALLAALEHVHRAGLVHRDVKPGNVLLGGTNRRRMRLKLTDFGLAAASGRNGTPGRLSGSIPYVAPEAILGGPVDGRSDLYGLGILLHHLATGRFPFAPRDAEAALAWHLSRAAADPSRLRPELPERFARLVTRLTVRDPDERPRDASEAESILAGATPRARPRPGISIDRRARARLRLDLDAARLGARRVLRLSASRGEAAKTSREAIVQAQVLGLVVHHLRRGRRRGSSRLGRLVLRALYERGGDARSLVSRHRLAPGLPLEFPGGMPVWSRPREDAVGATVDPGIREATADGIVGLLLGGEEARAMALVVDRGALEDPLARAVVARLAARTDDRAQPGRRGFLLVVDAAVADRLALGYISGTNQGRRE